MENPHCLGWGKGGPLVTKKSQLSVTGHTYQKPLPKMGSPYNNVLQLFLMSLRLKPDWILGCFHQFWVVLKMIILCWCQKNCIEFYTQRGSHKKFHTMKRKKTLHIKSSHILSLHIENIHIKWLCFHYSRHWTLNFRQHETKKMKWNIK
jgi:Na+/melibiose symporter-like transporter